MKQSIFKYLKKNNLGEIEDGLTEVDNFVLSIVSYLKFEFLIKWGINSITIADFYEIYKKNIFKIYDKRKANLKFLKLLAHSKRYQNLVLSNFVSVRDTKIEVQFDALMVELPNKQRFVSFRGTDESLVGWKEDFNLAFNDFIPSQELAGQYLSKLIRKNDHHKYYLGGHSKGGNLAIYAGAMLSQEEQAKIVCITNLDGPGFSAETLKKAGYKNILPLCKTYIPKYSVFGVLFNRKENVSVVASSAYGVLQHDQYTWLVDGQRLCAKEPVKITTLSHKNTLGKVMTILSKEEREDFVNTLYSLSNNIKGKLKIGDFLKLGRLFETYVTWRKLPKEKRKFVRSVFWMIIKTKMGFEIKKAKKKLKKQVKKDNKAEKKEKKRMKKALKKGRKHKKREKVV